MFPVLFDSAYFSIHTLWLFACAALILSSYVAIQRLKRRRLNFTLLIEHSTAIILTALFCSRLAYFLFHTSQYMPSFSFRTLGSFFSIWDQGLSLWGAVLGSTIALFYWVIKEEEPLWKWVDALFIPLMLGVIIGNMGAFLAGYNYGTPTSLPWGVEYNAANVKFTVPVHPTQIYALVLLSMALLSKHYLEKKTAFFKLDGNTTLYLGTLMSLVYFLLEFIRGDDTLLILGVRLPSILTFLVFLGFGWQLYKRYKLFKTEPHVETL